MSQNIGTLVSSAIRPNDSLDQIASAYANEIKGGVHGYETYTDMVNLIGARREWGMLVTVYKDSDSLNGTYQLKYEYSNNDILDDSNWVKINLGENTSSTEWVDSVIAILAIEPITPNNGDRYLLGTVPYLLPSGTNWDNYSYGAIIAEYDNNIIGSWKLTIPTNGMTIRVDNDDNSIYKYEGNYPTGIWKQEKITQVFYIEPISISGLTYSVSTDPIFNTYNRDLIFLTKFNTANTGTVSININGLGYKNIKIATKSGIRDLIISDILTNGIYSLTYNGTYFQMTKPFASDAYNIQYYISPGEVVTVEEHEQYWVYGDLTVDGTIENYGKVIIANGALNNNGIFNNNGSGELILVDLFNTPIFNTTDTIQLSSEMTINGPSVSAIVLNNSLTPSHINSINNPTASYLLSNNGSSFEWVESTSTRLFNYASNTYQTVSGPLSTSSPGISASMFSDGDVLRVQSIITLNSQSLATASVSYFINSTASLVGSTQIATYDAGINQIFIWTDRNFWSVGGTFNSINFTSSAQTSVSNSGSQLGSVLIPNTFYIFVSVTTTGSDLACLSSVVIQKL